MLRHLLAPLFVAACAVGWLAVQRAWLRVFPWATADSDALSGRLGCHGGSRCNRECERLPGERCREAKEDRS